MKDLIKVLRYSKYFDLHIIYIKEIHTFSLYPLFRIEDIEFTCYDINYICALLRLKINYYNCFKWAAYIDNYDKLCEEIKCIIDKSQIRK